MEEVCTLLNALLVVVVLVPTCSGITVLTAVYVWQDDAESDGLILGHR